MLNPCTATDERAGKLFRDFARTEYALKEAGFVKRGREQAAEADWEEFARQFGDELWSDPLIEKAAQFMAENPPKKQIFQDGQLCWGAGEKAFNGATLLRCVRRVRNNLCHGGKERRTDRDELLMQHSLEILASCLRACPKLKAAFAN